VDFVHELQDVALAADVVVIAGSVVLLCFLLVPLFFGADDPADPRALAPIGVPPGRIALGLAASALISVPAILLIVLAVAQVPLWSGDSQATLVSCLAAVLVVVIGVLGARLARSVAAHWLPGR